MSSHIEISGRRIGPGEPVYVIAELSANHGQSLEQAIEIVHAARHAGADAVKLQTYTPATLTIDSTKEAFRVGRGTPWEGRTLHDLYQEAFMPWEWQPNLKEIANDLGMHLFSSAFDFSSVEFLEQMDVPAYKIASFELVDIPLIRKAAKTHKPVIISTGMGTLSEVEEAVSVAVSAGASGVALLKCTSAYPAKPEEMHLRTIPHLAATFGLPVGLSDHTLGIAVPVTAVALGACIIEKHLTLTRHTPGPDSAFSLEPHEFKAMVDAVRAAERSLGGVQYGVNEREAGSRVFRRSLFVTRDMRAGEEFTAENMRSIRPGHGLPPKYYEEILGRRAVRDIDRGTPLRWDLLA
jgi:N-acetylneuraminate synthase